MFNSRTTFRSDNERARRLAEELGLPHGRRQRRPLALGAGHHLRRDAGLRGATGVPGGPAAGARRGAAGQPPGPRRQHRAPSSAGAWGCGRRTLPEGSTMLRIGWFSTGRGEGSKALLRAAMDAIQKGDLKAEIAFVFCNRERGRGRAHRPLLRPGAVLRLAPGHPLLQPLPAGAQPPGRPARRAPAPLAPGLRPRGGPPHRAVPLRPGDAGRLHAHLHRRHLRAPAAPEPAPGRSRRARRHLAGGHLGAHRQPGRQVGHHHLPLHYRRWTGARP